MSSSTNWEGRLIRRYGPIIDPLPEPHTLADFLPFVPSELQGGESYEEGIDLAIELGATHDDTGGSYTYKSAADSVNLPARLSGSDISVIGDIPRSMLHRLKKSEGRGGKDVKGLDAKMRGCARGAEFFRELALHYGPGPSSTALANIGVVSAIVSGTNLGAGGPVVCDLTRASWSAGIWNLLGTGNGLVDVYESDGSTQVESDVSVTYVKSAGLNRLSLSKSGSANDVDATDLIVPAGTVADSCVGVQGILENTGTLFGIAGATYPAWIAETYASGGALNRAKIMALGGRLFQNGLMHGGRLFVNGNAFADLADELGDLQQFQSKNGRTSDLKEFGAHELTYKTPCGNIEVYVDLLMKQSLGFFFGYDAKGKPVAKRIGATDNTFMAPGDPSLIRHLVSTAGSRVECYSNQAPLLNSPAKCAIVTGITSTGDTLPSA